MSIVNRLSRHFSQLNFTPPKHKLDSILGTFPWNFDSHYLKMPIQNLESPLDLQKILPSQEKATSLLKDFSEAIYSDDMLSLESDLEPSFMRHASEKVTDLHKTIASQNLNLVI